MIATDPENNPLTVACNICPTWITANLTNLIINPPGTENAGVYNIELILSDSIAETKYPVTINV